MKKTISLILAVLMLALSGVSALADPTFSTKVVTLLSASSVASTQTGSATSLSIRYIPTGAFTVGVTERLNVYLSGITASQSTGAQGATMSLAIQGRVTSSSDWVTLQPLSGTAASAWTEVSSASTGNQMRSFAGPIPNEIRAVMTLTDPSTDTGTATMSYTVKALAGG